MKGGPVYTIIFMLVISAAFTLILSMANAYYLPQIEENELLDDRRAILYVFELDTEGEPDEVLERFDEFEADGELPENDTYQKRRFDLCSQCCQRFLQEPLGRRGAPQFDFSKR